MAPEPVPEDIISEDDNASPANLNRNGKVQAVSKLRETFAQVCAASARNSLLITFGSSLAFLTILNGELEKNNIPISRMELQWMIYKNMILIPIGCIIGGPISQFFGRRTTMIFANIPFAISWLLLYFAANATVYFIVSYVFGIMGGLIQVSAITYVAEVTQPRVRGMLSATWTMAIIIGKSSQILASSMIGWPTLTCINAAFTVLCFFALCLVPESPYWLAGKGRLQEAEGSLCWLRGWVTPAHVREEFQAICESIRSPGGTQEKLWTGYTKRTFYAPFAFMIAIFFIVGFSSAYNIDNSLYFLQLQLNPVVDLDQTIVFCRIAQLAGMFICIFVIQFTGKRKLILFSTVGISFEFINIAVYAYLIENKKINFGEYTLLPMSLLIGIEFVSYLGLKVIPWILIGEVFPGQVKSVAIGAAATLSYVFDFVLWRASIYLYDVISLLGILLFYAAVNLLGAVVLYFLLPETEGRTLQEIVNHYAGIRNLKDKPSKEEFPVNERSAITNHIPTNEDIESEL